MIKKICASLWRLATLLEIRIKTKKIHCVLQSNQSQWLKPCIEFNTQKGVEAEKYTDKDGKALYKLMINAIYGKTIENLNQKLETEQM